MSPAVRKRLIKKVYALEKQMRAFQKKEDQYETLAGRCHDKAAKVHYRLSQLKQRL